MPTESIQIVIDWEARNAAIAGQTSQNLQNIHNRTKDLGGGINDLTNYLNRFTGGMGDAVSKLAAMDAAAGVAAASVAAIGVAAVVATAGIARYAEKQELLSERTGFSTTTLAGFRVAAAETGKEFEDLQRPLDFFTRKVGDAADGNKKATDAFARLGIGVKDAGGNIRDIDDIFQNVQDALLKIQNPAERASAAFQLFGRAGVSTLNALLMPMDQNVAKAKELGIALGPEAERVALDANKQFHELSLTFQGLANNIGLAAANITGPFLTALQKAIQEMAKIPKKSPLDFSDNYKEGKETQDYMDWMKKHGFSEGSALADTTYAPGGVPQLGATGSQRYPFRYTPGTPLSDIMKAWVQDNQQGPPAPKDTGVVPKAQVNAYPWEKPGPSYAMYGPFTGDTEAERIAYGYYGFDQKGKINYPKEMIGGEAKIPSGTFTDMDKYLASIKATDDEIKRATDSEGNLSLVTLGMNRVLDDSSKNALKLGETLGRSIMNLASTAGQAIGEFAAGTATFSSAMNQIVQSMMKALSEMAAASIGGPLGALAGGLLGGIGSAFHFAGGGTVLQGVRGTDSVRGLLQQDETVLDSSLTDALRSLVPELRSQSRNPGSQHITFGDVYIQSRELPTGAAVDDWVAAVFMPAVGRVMKRAA